MAAITRSFSARDLLRALLFVPLAGLAMNSARAAEPAVTIPAPAVDAATPAGTGPQTIVLAGGCFWGVQAVFQHIKGVTRGGLRLRRRDQADRELRAWSAPVAPATPSRCR